MAWTEQIGAQFWRARYRTGDGHTASISGFTTQRDADNYAADIECDQRRNTWLAPNRGRTTVADLRGIKTRSSELVLKFVC